MISGYIGYKTINVSDLKSFSNHLLKKAISLLIPLFTWSLLVNNLVFKQQWIPITLNDLTQTLLNPGLWFLKTLFEIFFFYGIFAWISSYFNKKKIILIDAISIVGILGLTLSYNFICGKPIFSSLLLYSIFFYIAVMISKHQIFEALIINELIFAFSFIAFIILSSHWKINGIEYYDLLKIIISCLSFIVLFNLTKLTKWNSFISKQLVLFGRYSLSIYIFQFYITNFFIETPFILFNDYTHIILFVICLAASIPLCYICIIVAKIIELNKFLNFIFLGKRVKLFQ